VKCERLCTGAKVVAALLVIVTVIAVAGGLMLRSAAAELEGERVARIAPAPPPSPVKPPIVGEDPLTALLQAATVLAPHSYGNLTIFPVMVSGVADFGSALTMDEALSRGLLVVEEVGSGAVNEVVALNRSDRHIFMMASEMVGGAKQDRTIGKDVLLAPYGKAHIPVFCVEAHRWTAAAPGAEFRSMDQSTPLSVRRTARLKQDQSEVWAQVSREQARLAAPSATGALRSVYESADVQRSLEPYLSQLADAPSAAPNVVGVVVARGASIVCADLFYRPDLFRRLWPKLLRSYAADAIGTPPGAGRATVGDAERFLGGLYHARRDRLPTPGVGYELRLQGGGAAGSALVFKRSVVHLEVFPGVELVREPPRPEPQMNLQFRRDRLERSPQ